MAEQLALLPGYLTAHLQLTLVALLLGTLVSVPLGICVTRRRSLELGVLGVASVIQTIPSLALLAIMVPVLAGISTLTASALGFELRSIGYAPALVALSLYSVLPILRNTVTGIDGVDASLIEAARGVGMTDRQQLLRVELPLAMPVMVAGLRTAAVWVVGTATLSTPVGATSLGNYIFSGLQTRNFTAVLVGCLAAAGLAIVLDQLIRALEVGVRDRRRRWVVLSVSALIALYAYTGASFAWDRLGGPGRTVAIGSKTFTEQYILSEILAGRIRDRAGLPTRAVQSLGSTVAFDALLSGDLDVYVDYDGTIWATIMKREQLPKDRTQVTREVKRYLHEAHGIVVVGSLGFENTYALGIRATSARDWGITRISELTPLAPRLEIGGDYEFFQRAEWASIQTVYGLEFRRERSMDSSLMYQAVAGSEVDVISAFSTDGRIAAYDIVLLEDDRGVIPPYSAIMLVSPRLAAELPQVATALEGLVGTIDAAAMRRMNLAVDGDGQTPSAVAREFLEGLSARDR
jgi:osmoprotectant transport system permease protein